MTFVSDGALECEIEENVFELNAGQAILILPGQIHSYKTRQYSKSYLCVFSNDWVHSFYDEVKGFHFENPTFSCDGEYYGKVLQDKKKRQVFNPLRFIPIMQQSISQQQSPKSRMNYTLH